MWEDEKFLCSLGQKPRRDKKQLGDLDEKVILK
jgi:hypothetical protein